MIDKPEMLLVCIGIGLISLSGNIWAIENESEMKIKTTPPSGNTQPGHSLNASSQSDAPLGKTAETNRDDHKGSSSVASKSIITIMPKHGNVSVNESHVPTSSESNATVLDGSAYVSFTDGYSSDVNAETLQSNSADYLGFSMRETAGFVATGFLMFAVSGYVGFVLWRRYLQKKYGSQTLITEEVYDISDLRHFEI